MALRVLFFGTPDFAVPTLSRLLTSPHSVAAVVTQPDRPKGRGQQIAAPPVKEIAERHHLRVFQPTRLNDESLLTELRDLRPDLGVVAAYGRLLSQRLLDLPRLGMINVHASLLPRWRGAAPVHRAVLAGDERTGVTIMRVVLQLDAGPMLASVATSIDPNETSDMLEHRLAQLGADAVAPVMARLEAGDQTAAVQDEAYVTYAAKLTRADSRIDWARPSRAVHNQIRGLQPWPLASARLNGRRLSLIRSEVEHEHLLDAEPGAVLFTDKDTISVACRPGAVRLLELQPEGRRIMTVREFHNGARVAIGDRFVDA